MPTSPAKIVFNSLVLCQNPSCCRSLKDLFSYIFDWPESAFRRSV